MATTLEHLDTSGLTIYAKPLPLVTPWGDDAVVLSEGESGYYSASVDPGADGYAVYQQAGGSPAASDGPATATVDTTLARTGADGDTLKTLSDQIDETSTHNAQDVADKVTTDHGDGSYVDSGTVDLGELESDVDLLVSRTDGGVTITSQSPVAEDGSLHPIVQGDSYLATDGRQFEWRIENHGFDLTDASVEFTLVDLMSEHSESIQGSITEDGADATLTFDLSATKSANLKVGEMRYGWDVQITLANPSRPVTPVRGRATVLPQYTQ